MCTRLTRHTLERRERALRPHRERCSPILKAAAAGASGAVTLTAPFLTAYASGGEHRLGDLHTVQQLIEFLMTLLQGIGIALTAFGVISLAMSFQSHDDSQKSKAMLATIGGCLCLTIKPIALMIAPESAQWLGGA